MVNCPECDAVLDVEEEDLDEGDTLSCDECGATLTVSSTSPLELEGADDDDDDEDDDDFDDDDYGDDEEDDDEDDDDWK